jgi:hypothetical protein
MNSTSSSSLPSDKEQIPVEEALRTIQSGLEKVDAERGMAFSTLVTLQTAKSKLLERHQSLLAQKLGPDDPRVLALRAASDLIKRQLLEIRAAQVQAVTPVSERKPAPAPLDAVRAPQAPENRPSRNPRETLKIIADGLSKNPEFGGVKKTSATVTQTAKAENTKNQNPPKPPGKKTPRKKRRARTRNS